MKYLRVEEASFVVGGREKRGRGRTWLTLLPVSDDHSWPDQDWPTQTLVSLSEPESMMTDGVHDAACGCFDLGPSYTPLTQEIEPDAKHMLTVQQGSELLTLTFSDVSFTVAATKPDGTGLLDA